jgi:hypothetical protein
MKITSLAKAAAALLLPLGVSATPVLSITPATQSAGFGQTVSVAVVISGLNSVNPNQIVSNFDLNVLFDTALLSQVGTATFQAGTQLDSANGNDFFDTLGTLAGNAAGNAYSLADDSTLEALQGDSFTLFTIDLLTGSTDGAAILNFGADPNFERLLVGLGGFELQASYVGACIAIGDASCGQVVPEPTSYGLVGVALFAAGLASRPRRRDLPTTQSAA